MTQRSRTAVGVNQYMSADMDEDKNVLDSVVSGTPATPPPTPTYPPSLADRRSTNRKSTGNIVPLRPPSKGRVPDVIDCFGRKRSVSCSEPLPESPKYIGTPLSATNGESIKKSHSFFGYECVSMLNMEEERKLCSVPDAKVSTTQPPLLNQETMDISSDKDAHLLSKTAPMVAEFDAECYNMNHERRGHFLILNHDKFDSSDMDRPGSNIDADELKNTAELLGFEALICNNLCYSEISAYIEKLAKMDHSNADCLAIAVLTHGKLGGYLHARDCLYSVERLWTPFAADLCPTLAGKPKLLFIQACRGEKLDAGTTVKRTETDSGVNSYKIPNLADFLVSHSTVDGYYSWRNPESGTWFIRSLCEELKTWAPEGKDLLRIMVKVHARVALQYQSFNEKDHDFHERKQVPSFVCMLTRELYLLPKKPRCAVTNPLVA